MPWKESNRMNERMKFVVRLEDGERMTDLCKEFGISRKSGYKIWNRYLQKGPDGLFDESRKPISNPQKTTELIEKMILRLKDKYPSWGAGKLREYLLRKHPEANFPSKTTFYNILLKNDLVKKRRKRTYKARGTNLNSTLNPNDLWCADFKGQFKMTSGAYCYPLTITDHESRFLLSCKGLESVKEGGAFAVFQETFENFGLPKAIRTDNGVPFASPNAILGLSKLSVWWLRLGIDIERITPGCPQENGRHERMHLTLKQDLLHDPSNNLLKQQEIFDHFIDYYNNERPHEGIKNSTPDSKYEKSRKCIGKDLPEIEYPHCDFVRTLALNGKMHIKKCRPFHVGDALIKQPIGITNEARLLVTNLIKTKLRSTTCRLFKFSLRI
jgi:transposase InsO family protein